MIVLTPEIEEKLQQLKEASAVALDRLQAVDDIKAWISKATREIAHQYLKEGDTISFIYEGNYRRKIGMVVNISHDFGTYGTGPMDLDYETEEADVFQGSIYICCREDERTFNHYNLRLMEDIQCLTPEKNT